MKPKARLVKIIRIESVSLHLRRIVFFSDELVNFPVDEDGAHVKVLLPHAGERLPQLAFDGPTPAIKRSYTIRSFDAESRELTIDFVINLHEGPATNWAKSAKVGDYAGIAGPGPKKLTDFSQDNYLMIGDITSVNAVNGFAKFMRPEATVNSIITVPTRADIIHMDAGKQLQITWHVEDETTQSLVDVVKEMAKDMPKTSHIFFGLEARSVRDIKSLLLHDLEFDRLKLFSSGYWKKGVDADKFNRQKQQNPL